MKSVTRKAYELSLSSQLERETYWDKIGKNLTWMRPYSCIENVSYDLEDFRIRWYEDGTLNASVNCIDRHLPHYKDRLAFIWEPNEPHDFPRHITYGQLSEEVGRFSNVLKGLGIRKGDCVTIYMPMVPEAVYAMLACARIGAIHCVVFAGFSAQALAERIDDCGGKIVITADYGRRGAKKIPLKEEVDKALQKAEGKTVSQVIVVRHMGDPVSIAPGRDHWYHELMAKVSSTCSPVEMGAEDPLFILYTSGSTGKPKGVLHTTGGYLAYAAHTHALIFNYQPQDIYWCTADIGWITGHTYIVYGPLVNAATSVIYEGIPTYPTASRCWEIVDRHQVSLFYTSPTAIRSLEKEGTHHLKTTKRASLRVLGSVGEPLNPEAWEWYHEHVGKARCPIVDTWWQTETGGILIAPIPFKTPLKAGSVTQPLPGIDVALLDTSGTEMIGEGAGSLVLKASWPGQMRGVYKDPQRFIDTYFIQNPGYYTTGDGAKRDAKGNYWITGRLDDVINVSGHRIGTAEVEYVIDNHPHIAESAVVGAPHAITGEGIYAFVVLMDGITLSPHLTQEVNALLRKEIGPIVKPEAIMVVSALPKTRSGKIMRRILKKIARGEFDDLGDVSTLVDPSVIEDLRHIRDGTPGGIGQKSIKGDADIGRTATR